MKKWLVLLIVFMLSACSSEPPASTGKAIIKIGYLPICEFYDSVSPRVSKYGGSIPHFANEGPPECQCCHHRLDVLLQLYISNLPEEIKQLFPTRFHQSLIVFKYCPLYLSKMIILQF